MIGMRDTKDREGGTLVFPRESWDDFIAGVKGSEFDL